jgi:hypothetical protein
MNDYTTHEFKEQSLKESPSTRTLKIEEAGDAFKGRLKPKIRLMGHWLERAGFKPGTRVSVRCLASGVIELRSG